MPRIPNTVRAIYFDAVGTLLFPEPPAPVVYAQTAQRHGLGISAEDVRGRFWTAYQLEEHADRASNWQTNEDRERLRWYRIVTQSLAGVANPEQCYRELFDHFAAPHSWRLAPGVLATLTQLQKRGIELGLGSNYDDRLRKVLSGFPELAGLHDRVVISAEVGIRKPGRGFFEEAARRASRHPHELLFVGDDRLNDYEGAVQAGWHAILFDPHNRHPDVPQRITQLTQLVE
ncbi:MAG: HAD-IA family hydrolase [Gemmataceae bacterium]|nr:HAD-IA family hydrolase [Gemmata sp.]MDW8196086.1 HAD-IA family hydrolase [Gemmataceae bacterium]